MDQFGGGVQQRGVQTEPAPRPPAAVPACPIIPRPHYGHLKTREYGGSLTHVFDLLHCTSTTLPTYVRAHAHLLVPRLCAIVRARLRKIAHARARLPSPPSDYVARAEAARGTFRHVGVVGLFVSIDRILRDRIAEVNQWCKRSSNYTNFG